VEEGKMSDEPVKRGSSLIKASDFESLRTENAKLRAEKERLKVELENRTAEAIGDEFMHHDYELRKEHEKLQAELMAAQAPLKVARDALKVCHPFMHHRVGCVVYDGIERVCDCGFAKACNELRTALAAIDAVLKP
jgi:hypothetical protein